MTPLPDPDRWRIIAPILEEALDLPPDRRGAFLDRACSGDPAIRAEIEALLEADSQAGPFLAGPVDLAGVALPDEDDAGDAPAVAGTYIGPYRVVREIGRGGMGVVYEAEQQRPRRPVALKVILGGRFVDPTTVRMFQREVESLARLRHPGIASILESGSTDDGQHYFAMELVRGRTLSEFLDAIGPPSSRPDLRSRLAMFRKIASAVAYAHQRGVIHRDLKPSNILVLETPDGVPDVKVLDFGLARITDPEAEGATAVTALGRVQGTLPYMSPEQVRGRRDEIDARTDVYALGVILYRMLTGRPPYDLDDTGFPEAARIVCETPPRPLRAAGGRAKFDRDLSIIALKALEKAAAMRYPTVAALDEEIARYLAGQPILARPSSAIYQIRKLVARHTVPFAAAGVVLASLLATAIVATVQARRIGAERDRANREARTALRVSDFLTGLFKVSDPGESRGNAIQAREILDKGVEKIEKELAGEPEVQARLMLTMGNVYTSLGLFQKAAPILEKSVEMRRHLLGEDHPDTLTSMDSLAFLYQQLGRAADGERLYRHVLEARRRLLGDDHEDTLQTTSGLAWVYRLEGRYADEEKLHRRVYEARRRLLGEEDPSTLLAASYLAGTYWIERRYEEAEALYRPTVERQRRVLGADHPRTLGTMLNMADVWEAEGRATEAEALLKETLEGMRRVLGEEHPLTLSAMNDLAVNFDHQGRYGEAGDLHRRVLEIRRRVLGNDHPDTMSSVGNLATMLSVQGRHKDAESLFREALRDERRLLGEDHPDTVNTLYNLACNSALRGDRRGALDWLGQAVAHGLSNPDMIARDADLKVLRGDPAFEALVNRARKNSTR